jgi:glutaminase
MILITIETMCFQLLSVDGGAVPISSLLRALRNSGLWKNDPRLAVSMSRLQQYVAKAEGVETSHELLLSKEMFRECIRDNVVLIRRALTGDFVIPEFSKFCGVIDDIYWACRTHSDGKVTASVVLLLADT